MFKYFHLTPLFCAAIGTAIGFYFLASLAPAVNMAIVFLSLVVLCFFRVLSSLNRQERVLQLISVCSTVFTAALMLGICAANAGRNNINFALPEEKIIAIEGVLLEDPRIISGGRAMASVSLRRCAGDGGLRASSSGTLTVFFPEENSEKLREFGRGSAIFAEGWFRSSDTGKTFSANSLHVVKPAPPLEQMRTRIRLGLIDRFDGKNWGGLALALLLGVRDNLDTDLTAMYRSAGCSYILALSGMHLAVLTALIAFLLKKPFGLKAASIVGAVIICLYCFLVGPMPSLYRAALMYLLGVFAILGNLPKKTMAILCLSFLIQIVISPAAGYSISFILSYIALAGILVIGQPLYLLFTGKIPDPFLRPLSVSCGAFIATASITSFYFGLVVPMGIITGFFIVPLTTVFMIGSLAWLFLDFFSLSGFLNLPLSMIYGLKEWIVSLGGRVGSITDAKPSVILVVSLFMSLLIVVFEYRRRSAILKLQPFS